MCKLLIVEGERRRLYWLADASGTFRAKDYYDEKLDDKARAKFDARFNRMAREGVIRNRDQFRHVSKHISYFKVGQHRITYFYDNDDLIVTSGFVKKTDKDTRYRRRIDTAEDLRTKYFERKSATTDEAETQERA